MSSSKISAAVFLRQAPEDRIATLAATADPGSGFNSGFWYEVLQALFKESILVAPCPISHLAWQGLIVHGHYHPQSPLAAIRAALTVARNPQLFILDPELPFLSPDTISRVAALAEPRWDVLALDMGDRQMPLPLVCHQRCLKLIHQLSVQPEAGLGQFLQQAHVHTLSLDQITQ